MAHVEPTATEHEPRVGYYHNMTQEVCNDLGMWHKGRRLRTSNWQAISNAVTGKPCGEFESEADDEFMNSLLQLANANQPDTILRYAVPGVTEIREEFNSRNMLLNGAFKLRNNPYMIADWWNHSGTVDFAQGLVNNNSVSMDPTAGAVYVEQNQYLNFPTGTHLCGSCFYRILPWAYSGGDIPSEHAIILTIQYKDGTTSTARQKLSAHTYGQWERAYASITPTKHVDKVTFRVQSQQATGFTITQNVQVDGCMLELSTRPSQWEPHRNDSPQYVNTETPPPIDFEAEYPLHYVDTLNDFWFNAVPTRTGVTDIRANTITQNNDVGYVRLVDYFDANWDAEFDFSSNSIRKIGITCPGEVYGTYDLAFFNYRGFYDTNVRYTIVALAWLQDRLWVVANAVGLPDGVTKPILCVVDPNVPSPEPDYLEVMGAVELPGIPSTIDRAEFRYDDQQHIYLGNSTNEYRVRLYYDYFMFDTESYWAYFREQYDQLVLTNATLGDPLT